MEGSADRWLALLAGRNTWHDAEREVDPAARSLALLEVTALAAALSSVLLVAHYRPRPEETWFSSANIVLICTAPLALVGPVRTACGLVSVSRAASVNVLGRAALGILVSASVFALAPSWWAMFSWPIGVALGCDAALTATVIGWRPRPVQWWSSVFLSPFHLGIIGGITGGTLARAEAVLDGVLPIYATLHAWLLTTCATAWICQQVIERQRRMLEQARADTIRNEHRRSAHWLHDDICAQLRLVTLQVQTGEVSLHEVGGLLDELDFALRLRQLDELIESGSVRLAEVLQPFLRNAQNYGVTVERVPSYDLASTEVDHDTGIAFRRAAAVLTSNALNAGATTLSFDVAVHEEFVELTVTDDAGGFDPADITAGRGLWSLRHDLGPDNLTIERVDCGSRVRALVPSRQREQSWHT